MKQYAGIDVSLELSSVCVVDAEGGIVREDKVLSEPEALVAWFAAFGGKMGTHTHFAGATRRAAFDASRTCPRFIIAAAFGLLASLAAQGSMAQAASADEGHDLVQRDCAMCHAVDRTGASPNPGAPAFRDLHLRYPVNSLAVALAEGTIIGHPQMPQYKFSTDQIADIIRYLNSIQTLQPSRIDPVNHPSRSSGSLATQRVPANP